MDEKYAIRTANLRKVYKVGSEKVVALDNINLSIPHGEICCLLGTSGSGKSTLLNLLAGLEKPSRGTIHINGRSIESMSEAKLAKFRQKSFGFVFQSYNLLPSLTAIENVSMPLLFKGVRRKRRTKLANDMLNSVGLNDRKKHKPTQMSGGQQQRVGIARAFVANPLIVFADEPTGNLDTKTTVEVIESMVNMTRERNRTLIIVTHDPEISEYADRIIHIRDGNIIEDKYNDTASKGEQQNEKPLV